MKRTGKTLEKCFGKRLFGLFVIMLLLNLMFISCGQRDNSKVGKEVEVAHDDLDRNKEEGKDENSENLINVVEESNPLLVQQWSAGDENNRDVSKDGKQQIRDGEELAIIRAQYQLDKETGSRGSLFQYPEYLIEINIPELYTKTQMKVYQAFTLNDNPAGNYILYNQIALPVLDSFEETCIADVDQNGDYELLSLFGFGSGIYRINLNVYQASNLVYFSSTTKIPTLRYHNCFVPKAGFAKLTFDQVSDSEVHLREVDEETDQVGQDYGKLVIQQEVIITLENLEGFPYDIWDEVFVQDNWSTQAYDYESLTAIPELNVSVSDIIIPNRSGKKDWNGEKEEIIDFCDTMTDPIPQFTAPSDIYKYDQEIKLEFQGVNPSSIKITDTLITKEGQPIYSPRESLERCVRKGDDGAYYLGLQNHFALLLSSNTASYTNPSYRGFRVICEYGENRSCEYVFVLSLGPIWKENK